MDDLPPLYRRWMRSAAGVDMPAETNAACATCVMLPVAGASRATDSYFNTATKCCTYLPELHNFLVGAVLADAEAHPAGVASVERRIAEGVEVTPLGLGHPRSHILVYADGGDLVFGRAAGLRCPHYLDDGGGSCGIWQHRNSTCATWFCKHVRGQAGNEAWRTIQRALRIAEVELAWWCVREVGIDLAAVGELLARTSNRVKRRVTATEIDRKPDVKYDAMWGAWRGRERDFYRRCADLVRDLEWDDVLRIASPQLALAADVVRSRVDSPPARLDQPLRVAAFSVLKLRDGEATITTYSGYDPLTLPTALLDALDAFDGRPLAAVLEELAQQREIEIEMPLIQRLIDFGVLTAFEREQS